MKLFKTLLLLMAITFGLSSCGDDLPATTPITGTQWQLRNLQNKAGGGRTTTDILLSFERGGKATITVGFGSITSQSNGSGSNSVRREQETTLTTTYRYYNGGVHINPAFMSALTEKVLKGTEVLPIVEQLYTDAILNESKTLLTFYPFDKNKTFSLQRVGR